MDQEKYFDKNVSKWIRMLKPFEVTLIEKSLHALGITAGKRVLDIGCGTGVLYPFLKKLEIVEYRGIDISRNMLDKFQEAYPEVNTIRRDFNEPLQEKIGIYDYVIIYNSIPHFDQLDIVFRNAHDCLSTGGIFSIIHARSRQGLRDHHKRIGYQAEGDPIPRDGRIKELCLTHGFQVIELKDEDYFYLSCRKIQ